MGRLRPIFNSKIAEGRFPPVNGRPYFWYVDSSSEPSTKSSSEKKLNSIPLTTINLSPGIREEVNQMRSMILHVMEELVNTESSYLRILTQFILLREEIFAPNWRADRQKFMRLFPATVDDLCRLHRDSCEAMRRAYEEIPQNTRQPEALSETSIREEPSFRPHRYRPNVPAHQPHRSHRRHPSNKSTGENETTSSSNCTEVSQDSASPFTVLLEMIEGQRPLGTSPNSSYCSIPIWSTSPLFKLYTRYLSEFSGSIQTLSKIKTGPTSLRKQLRQLQSHPACEFNDITTYLLAPVQRLPRYRLLIQKMIQYTEKMYRLLGLKSTRKQDSKKVTPDLPSLEELKRADDVLHKMLMELDEMMDMDMMDLKMEYISGGAEGTQRFAKKNSETGMVCSNNCSENGIKRTISKLLPGEIYGEDHISRCQRSQSLVDAEGKKSRARSTGRTGLWNRLKRLRFTFSSSHNYSEDKDEINKQTATVLTSISAKESVDGNESQKSIPLSTNLSLNIAPLGSVRFQETLERTGSNLDEDYTFKVESWNKMPSTRMYARTTPSRSATKRPLQTIDHVQKRHAISSDENRRNCRSLLTTKFLQSADSPEICKPAVFNNASEEKRQETHGHGEMQPYTRNSTISSNSSNSQAQNVIPRPTRLLIGKSDSDSGVHTQPEDTPINATLNRQRAHFPMTPATNKLRWIVNRSHSRIEDTPDRLMSSSYQKHTYQCRVDAYRLTTSSTTTNLDDETNPNLSSISIASSSSSSFVRDNATRKMGDLSESQNIQGATNISSTSDDNKGRNQYKCNHESVDSGTDADEVFTNDSMKSESGEIETQKNNAFDVSTPRFAASPKTNSDIRETEPCTDTTKLTTFDLVPIVGLLCLDEAC